MKTIIMKSGKTKYQCGNTDCGKKYEYSYRFKKCYKCGSHICDWCGYSYSSKLYTILDEDFVHRTSQMENLLCKQCAEILATKLMDFEKAENLIDDTVKRTEV